MADVIVIKGKVRYTITLDPTVWIFDDRKVPMAEAFDPARVTEEKAARQDTEVQTAAERWVAALRDGAVPTAKSEALHAAKQALDGDWGMPLAPFLQNAGPDPDATAVICHLENGERVALSMEEAKEAILQFAKDGKPIRDSGPVHLYYGDGRNRDNPIKGIAVMEVV
ncbi:MAG TPA: peptidyl-prolyl cis-trans isomerase [Calditerricola sp.]